jgi:hypothetical protein
MSVENKGTRVIRSLFNDVDYLSQGGLSVIEVPFSGLYSYIFLYPKNVLSNRALGELSGAIANALLTRMLSKDDIKERYTKRETLVFSESGDASLSVFKAEQKGRDTTLSSPLLGVEINVRDTGMNFIFYLRAQKTEQAHQEAEAILNQGGYWLKRLEEIYVQFVRPDFTGQEFEGEYFYGYTPIDISTELLKYVPVTNLMSIDAGDVMKSFKSEKNEGVQIGSIFGTPVYFRIALPTKDGVDNLTMRRATVLMVDQEKIFMRSTTGIVAEFVVKSTTSPFDVNMDETFDYVKEQERMNEAAKTLYLGLWQYVNNRNKNRV